MEERRKVLLDFVKEALRKGHPEPEVRKVLTNNKISWVESASILAVARTELGMDKQEQDEKDMAPERQSRRLPALLIVILGFVAMAGVFLYRMVSPGSMEFHMLSKTTNLLWPFIFPMWANLMNLIFFRKRFLSGFIISLIVVILLAVPMFLLPLLN